MVLITGLQTAAKKIHILKKGVDCDERFIPVSIQYPQGRSEACEIVRIVITLIVIAQTPQEEMSDLMSTLF